MAKLVLDQIVKYNETEMQQGLHVLFSAHGVPESYIESECVLCIVSFVLVRMDKCGSCKIRGLHNTS